MDGRTIKLISNDDVSFDVSAEALMASTVISHLLEVCVDNGEPIPILRVDGDTLKKVIEYLEYHKDDPIVNEEEEEKKNMEKQWIDMIQMMIDEIRNGKKMIEDEDEEEENPEAKRTDNLSEWDLQFVNVDQSMLINLIFASLYLDIQSLYDVVCKRIAHLIKDKTPVELRKLFKITRKNFTPEGEEHFRFLDKWMLEAEKNEMISMLKNAQERGRKGRKWKKEKAAIKRLDKKILKLKKKGLYYKGKR